ncbi:energy transducer TonB [Avibacterium sp. 21-586]|uniref:energy transducer TonB family protein n=1 Tax=Avibacterium sp. 21-586 TaxID=2911534 RepID=UPI0022473DB9|nr:energy transducer TonB [Avibacterium sp. 21-586]MCW9710287.1 energy transducer TonB [Avibacterium sp. 21-586]
MIIEVPSLWQNKRYLFWLVGMVFVVVLHLFIFHILAKKNAYTKFNNISAVMVEFSDPPQSIVSVQEFAIGPPQIITQDSQKTDVSEPEVKKEVLLPRLDESESMEQAEIVVEKKDKPVNKEKIKPIKKVKKTSRKENKKKKQVNHINSVATGQAVLVAPDGDSNKIAAEFNSSGNLKTDRASWQSLLMAHLQRYQRYPAQSLKNQIEGKPIVTIEIDHSGRVLSARLKKSSGNEELDSEAVNTVRRASPLPKPPYEIMGQKTHLKISFGVDFFIHKKRK